VGGSDLVLEHVGSGGFGIHAVKLAGWAEVGAAIVQRDSQGVEEVWVGGGEAAQRPATAIEIAQFTTCQTLSPASLKLVVQGAHCYATILILSDH